MSKILYIEASPRGERSHAIAVARAFVDAYRKLHPEDTLQELNVFRTDLIPFDGLAVTAKYTILHGKEHSAEEREAWSAVEERIAEFKAADKYVFAVPMWNFGIPYRLKQYVDIIVQPGYTFSYDPQKGYTGLVTGKRAFIAYASGGEYPVGSEYEAYDFQRKYMATILGFMGITDLHWVVVEPTLMQGPEVAAPRRAAAIEKARKMAAEF